MLLTLFAILATVALVIGLLMKLSSRRGLEAAGIASGGEIASQDDNPDGTPGRLLYSNRYGLAGRPDYLIRLPGGAVVPVEAKSSMSPRDGRPRDSHLAQLAVYCLLVRDEMHVPVSRGVIRYRDRSVDVPFSAELQSWLLAVVDDMRTKRGEAVVHRNHQQRFRCGSCGFRETCGESLA